MKVILITVSLCLQFVVCIRKNGETVYQKVLTGQRESTKSLRAWEWQEPREGDVYHALYPRAWTVYHLEEFNLRLICRQVSPIFPHDYKVLVSCVGVISVFYEPSKTNVTLQHL